ncbi:uncharacterized protein LOC107632519 [Arachis ipaensis]|uniref:uncharacterized protein LOC107632519 n=1 Tax=Arachis ipaensis TaxID=130454 RepID=UPI0007AF035D|nr:uncharacterized protein LOC107632519 [Arachis ipaensis]
MIHPSTIWIILSLAVIYGWPFRQFDFNNTFLNGDLTEDVFMLQHPSFVSNNPSLVRKLDKAIYGLNKTEIDALITDLNSKFSLKDLGSLNYFLGLEFNMLGTGELHISQSKYILDLLRRVGLFSSKPVPTPMLSSFKLISKGSEPYENSTLCRSLVGGLQYATLTHPKISISESNWASDIEDHRSTNGYCVFLGNNPVFWCSRKQMAVSRSSIEAEFRCLADVGVKILWVLKLLQELGIP